MALIKGNALLVREHGYIIDVESDGGGTEKYIIDLDSDSTADREVKDEAGQDYISNADEVGEDYADYDIKYEDLKNPGEFLVDMVRKEIGGQDYDDKGWFI